MDYTLNNQDNSTLVYNTNINKVNKYNEKINNIKNQFNSILQDYKKYYVFFYKNPEVNEYSNFYYNSKNQLINLNNNLFNISLNIGNDIDKLNETLKILKEKINFIKNENNKLELLSKNLENKEEGSEILINNKKELYNIQYLQNWIIIFGIILISIIINKLIKK